MVGKKQSDLDQPPILGYLETWEVNGYLIRKVVKFKENKMCKVNISQVSLKLECSSDHQYVGQIVNTLCNSILQWMNEFSIFVNNGF